MSQPQNNTNTLPPSFFDAHHHFVDTAKNGETFQHFVGQLIPNTTYLPQDYQRDVVDPIVAAGIDFKGSTHMECIPDDGVAEAQWIEGIVKDGSASYLKAIVASCNLANPKVQEELAALSKLEHVKGIRWILDCVGKFDGGKSATHVATKRHDGVDYLRGSDGGYDGSAVPAFESGFSMLEKYGLTFDLQCAPVQLPAAAELCQKYPNVKVVIDHLGKPRTVLGGGDEAKNDNLTMDETELSVWRKGMKAMAQSSENTYVKISMLGYVMPGWIRTPERLALMKSLVLETVEIFTPQKCMVATNFWNNAAVSDADGMSEVAPEPVQFLELVYGFLKDSYSAEELDGIFCKNAMRFYGVEK